VGKGGGEYGAAASAENQPEGTDEFGAKPPHEQHIDSLSFWPAGGQNARIGVLG